MELIKNTPPVSDVFLVNYEKIKNISQLAHGTIQSTLNEANLLYNNSSVMEDIIVEDFLSLYTNVKDIDFISKNNNIVVESFLTTSLADNEFNSGGLNIDTQNGNIILPIKETSNIPVSRIIVETESNGVPGNSFNSGANSDINVILSSESQALFEYERVTSSVNGEKLILAMTLTLENESIMNGAYIKFFTQENGKYPTIDVAEVSRDGVEWSTIKSDATSSNMNKADHFIRFIPRYVKYLRLRFIQEDFESIKTIFGYRYRSMIGIREITAKQISYDTKGEYISIPFSTGKAISSAIFKYNDISNKDIKYFISGNNGTRWIPVERNGQTITVTNENSGILNGEDIKNLRVKIQMDKSGSVLNKIDATEYFSIAGNNKYNLTEEPEDISLEVGRLITYGRDIFYECEKQNVKATEFLFRGIPYDKAIMVMEDGLTTYLRVYVDGVEQTYDKYEVNQTSNPNNFMITFNTAQDGTAIISADFWPVRFTPSVKENLVENLITNEIKLPSKMFYSNESDIIVKENGNILSSDQYEIIGRDRIRILTSSFNGDKYYDIAYTPSFDVTCSIKNDANYIELGAATFYNRAMLRFDYTYKSAFDSELIKYYTPIGLDYSVEIK